MASASPSTPKRVSARIVVGSFWLLVIVVTTVVAGQMKAMMMVREEADRIDSMRHLAARPAMKPYTIAGSAGVSSVRDSKDPDYQKVWRMMQKHKADQPTSVVLADKTMREVVTGKAVLILSRASVAARATAACASFKRGEFYLAREPMFKFNSVFYLSKRLSADRRRDINNSYDLIPARDTQWGLRKEDGNWTGLIGMVQRDEVGLALSVINPSAEAEDVAFGVQIFVPIELVILAGRTSWSSGSILDTARIFSWQAATMWALIERPCPFIRRAGGTSVHKAARGG
ncbi:hypothetical protein V5799_032261 [Amblyomma americanum]|uniref:Uncharacterized protein n=1 Tax=Amblyomma americanum TaxID=6943 RepID=A0AAQ4DRP0_AMBAM